MVIILALLRALARALTSTFAIANLGGVFDNLHFEFNWMVG
jgi:hypothetical protein